MTESSGKEMESKNELHRCFRERDDKTWYRFDDVPETKKQKDI